MDASPNMVPTVCFTSTKAFIGNKGFDGSKFLKGDCVIAKLGDDDVIFTILRFLSVRCSVGSCNSMLFVVGNKYEYDYDENGASKDFWSGFLMVKNHVLPDEIVIPLENIERDVILYKIDDTCLCVADYKREAKKLPYEIFVPAYFEIEDMVLIQGEGLHDVWHAKIHKINLEEKTLDVFFFVQSRKFENITARLKADKA